MQAIDHFGEADSLHTVLRKLTDSYLICQECYSQNNIPQAMSLEDFEAQTLSHMLKPPSDAATAVLPDQD